MDRLKGVTFVMTGAAGFLGRQLSKALLKEGAAGIGIDIAACPDELKGFDALSYIQQDLRNCETELSDYIKQTGNEKVVFYHMVGMANAQKCDESPEMAFDLNIRLLLQALDFCRKSSIDKIVFPSTGLVYKVNGTGAADEGLPTISRNIYTVTKLAAESLLHAYSESYKLCGITVRLSNVYGPGMTSETVLGTMIKQVMQGDSIEVKDLTPVRDFIYIDDVTEGILRLSLSIDAPGYSVVNLSTGTGHSIMDAAEIVCRIVSLPQGAIRPAANSNPSQLILDNHLLQKITGWKPRYTLTEGLLQTIQVGKRHCKCS